MCSNTAAVVAALKQPIFWGKDNPTSTTIVLLSSLAFHMLGARIDHLRLNIVITT